MSKRDYCMQLAKEDSRRFHASEQSLTFTIQSDQELADLSKVLTAKAPKEVSHLRTVDAWMRRASSVRMTQLLRAVEKYVQTDAADKSGDSRAESSVIDKMCIEATDELKETEVPEKAESVLNLDTSVKNCAVSTVSLRNPDAKSVVSVERADDGTLSVISAAAVSTASKRHECYSEAGKRAATVVSTTSTHSKAQTPSSSSQSNVNKIPFADDDGVSRISIKQSEKRSSVGTTVSLSSVKGLSQNSEDDVNCWYMHTVGELERQYENSELRPEQFKRKRALLRAEYWTRLDKLRNNATPTIIG